MKRIHILLSRPSLFCAVWLLCGSACAQIPSQLDTGYPENGIFHGTEIENVQINNGGLHVEIPVSQIKGRGLSVSSKVVYNSKGWTFHTRCFTSGGGFCEDDVQGDPLGYPSLAFFGAFDYEFSTQSSTCTTGSGTGLPDISYTQVGGYTMREADGTKHHFVPDPLIGRSGCIPPSYSATLYADDGSGWIMHVDTSDGSIIEATDKNGTRIQPPAHAAGLVPAALIVDANGNQMASSNTCCTRNGWGGTDTLGRTVQPNGAYYDSSDALQSPSFSGSVSVAIDTTPLCTFSSADSCVPDKSTWTLPTQLNLPNGDLYTFTYAQNAGGEVASITLPTGGQISYTWGAWDTGGRNVATRKLSSNEIAGTEVTGTWTYNLGPNGGTVTDPAGKDTRYTCVLTPDGTGCGAISNEESFDGPAASSSLIKTVSTDYSINGIGKTQYYLPIRETTTWPQFNLVTKTETDWDLMTISGVGTVTWRNPVEKRFYDWTNIGNQPPLLKRVHTSYRHLEADGTAYLNANIADLPTLIQTYQGSATTPIAQTQNSYDGSTPANTGSCASGGVPNHDYCNYPYTMLTRGNLTQSSQWLSSNNSWLPTTHTYDDLGNLRSTTDPGNHQTTFDYTDSWGGTGCVTATSTLAFPTTITDALGHHVKTSFYPCTSLVQSTRDENDIQAGRTGTTHTYDSMNRPLITEVLDSNRQLLSRTSFTYNDLALPLSITKTIAATPDPDIVSRVTMDGLGRTLQTILNDPEGNVTTETSYDALGRKASVTNPHRVATAATDGTTQFVYDALGRTTDVIKPDGNTVHTDYAGNVTTVTDESGRQRRSVTDGLGELIEVDEPGDNYPGIKASGSISVTGALQNHPQGGTSATGTVTISGTERTYKDTSDCSIVNGREVCATAPDNGSVWISVNGVKETYFFGDGDTATSISSNLASDFNTDPASPVYANLSGTTITLTSRAVGSGTNYALSAGQTSHADSFIPTASGATLTGGADGPTVYDSGTVTLSVSGFTASAPYGQSSNSTATAVAAALVGIGPTGLNRAGSPVNATASGTTISITYNTAGTAGDVSVTINSSTGDPADFAAGSFCSPQCTAALAGGDNPEGPSLNHSFYVTKYTYDTLGNLYCVEQHGNASSGTACPATPPGPTDAPVAPDPNNPWRRRLFAYDSVSRLRWASNPESGKISYSYDPDGNLLQKTSPAPNQTGAAMQIISYCYDPLHRVTGKAYSAQACPLSTPAVTYTYDIGSEGVGHMTSLTDQAGSGAYTYDPMGRIKTEQRILSGVSKTMGYGYDAADQLTSVTYPSNATVTYTPDAAGHTISAADVPNSLNYATAATYAPDGSLAGFLSGKSATFAGMTNSFTYNQRFQPVSMSASSPTQTVFSIGYDFHAGNGNNGNVWNIYNYRDRTRDQAFTYDALNRLISAQNAGTDCSKTVLNQKTEYWGNSYSYDPWGNLINKSITKCGAENLPLISNALNRADNGQALQDGQVPSANYQYDAAGNMLWDATENVALSYDQENRITGANGYTYIYDADGNRVEKSNGTTGTLYWYMTPGIVAESDLSGNLKSEYVFFNGERIARHDFGTPGGVFYYFSDHLKTASVITDSTGNIKAESDYYPWGGELQFVNSDTNHYKFTGKERDETGLDYFGARYYSSGLGRFITPDWAAKATDVPYAEFADPQSLNLYSYVRNVPTTRFDADGHCDWCRHAWDFGTGVVRGIVSSASYGAVGAPRASDSNASLAGQVVGTAIEGAAGTVTRDAGLGVAGVGLATEVPSAGTSTVVVAVGAGTTAIGAGMELGAAKNAGAIVNAMSNNGEMPQNNLGGGQIGAPDGPKPGSEGGPSAGRRATDAERKQALSENNGKCVFCGGKADQVDHSIPRSRDGNNTRENLQPACANCNQSKGAKTSEEFLRDNNKRK